MPNFSCTVCGTPFGAPIYKSNESASLTSLCRILPVRTTVYSCNSCAHLQTPPLDDLQHYYSDEYDILVDSEDEDQIYEIQDATPVFRTTHQVNTLLQKLGEAGDKEILDYGCAKSSTMRAILKLQPNLRVHLFDVSSRYIPYWEKFLEPERWAVHETPVHWREHFDLITSFFSLEHIPGLPDILKHINSLLRPGGTFYAVVPNVLTNIADFIVIDHCNHFTTSSLCRLVTQHGLVVELIDSTSHNGALILVARKATGQNSSPVIQTDIDSTLQSLTATAEYWRSAGTSITAFESSLHTNNIAAIYGAGFYGAFIASNLSSPDRIVCHIDQNHFLHGKDFNGLPVVPPNTLPENVDTIYVGLNPRHARKVIANIPSLQRNDLQFFFL